MMLLSAVCTAAAAPPRASHGMLLLLLSAVCTAAAPAAASSSAAAASWPLLFPQPSSLTLPPGTPTLSLSPDDFTLTANLPSARLSRAFARYRALLFLRALPAGGAPASLPAPSAALTGLAVTLAAADDGAPPALGDAENYTLTLPAAGGAATLAAATVFGALRGLETLTQLAWWDGASYAASAATVVDAPRFAWRGALIDTARHFLPLPALRAAVDALAAARQNVLHWHIVDDQSFPYQSTSFPNLSVAGAWGAPATTHVYSQADVAALIAYAADRGLRVVPEFDTPGHSLSWGRGQPGLLTPCYTDGAPDGTFGPIDPSSEASYAFLAALLAEVAAVFPDRYLHIGGDEVDYACWQSNPAITAFMAARGIAGNYAALESLYVQRVLGIVQALGKVPIGWQELFDNGLNLTAETVVAAWKNPFSAGQEELARVTAAGQQVILASGWYLNYVAYVTGGQWRDYYLNDPTNFTGTAAQKQLVVGGEWSLWSEYVDATNFISRSWPTAGAVAERLWSPASVRSLDDAALRLQAFACRLVARGIPAEPADGPSYCPTEFPFIYAPPTEERDL